MAIDRGLQNPKKGMNRDTNPFELSGEEYSFALNANIHDEHGNGAVVLQNEPSNRKCTSFKPGFKVIGHKYDADADRTYFFLVNPLTNISEIGFVPANQEAEELFPVEETVDGELQAVLEAPLEIVNQEDACVYTTLLSDYCEITLQATGALGFSIDFPIFTNNIQIKVEKTGKNLYFTDNNNPQRYIQLDRLHIYNQDIDPCTQQVTQTCLQTEKMRVFPLHNKPCLRPEVIQNGGNLRAGTYEVLVASSDSEGNELTNYYGATNVIPVHDRNNNILDQTNLDYITNQAISIEVIDIDPRFEFYKIVVIYRSGLDGAVGSYENGVYPVDQTKVTIATLTDKVRIDLANIISRRPFYIKARGLAQSNGYLFHYGLTQHRDINLQPVVNLMGSLARWMTVQARENLYEDGVFISNYKSVMRDEVYPYGIKFFVDGGYETALFPFIPRPPKDFEIQVLGSPEYPSNTNTESVLANNPECSVDLRNKRWQFENTATVDDEICTVPSEGTGTVDREEEVEASCFVSEEDGTLIVVTTISSSSVELTTSQDLVTYINLNQEQIISSTGTNGEDIRDIISDAEQFPETCTPSFGENCSDEIEFVGSEMFAISVDSEERVQIAADFDDYERVPASTTCPIYSYEDDGVTLIQDTTFMTAYMDVGEVVYRRSPNPTNNSCANAQFVPNILLGVNSQYLMNKGEVTTFATLRTSIIASQTLVVGALEFTDRIHSNAIWFKGNFNSKEKTIIELGASLCNNSDDNSENTIRVSIFTSCASLSDVATYSRIISDITTTNDVDKFIELNASDFGGINGEFFIAIDSPIKTSTVGPNTVYTLTPPCGCFPIYQRDVIEVTQVNYTNLKFGKKVTYKSLCSFSVPVLGNCDPIPYQKGLFSYWESLEKYPCNNELYDSSDLVIKPSDIPEEYRDEFEEYYTDGIASGNYVLTGDTNFMDKPIRHYKYPCSTTVPFMSFEKEGEVSQNPGPNNKSVIYPIGFFISNTVINAFLDIAVQNGLITPVERSKIRKYEIFRGDRTTDKSIIAKGLLFDDYVYGEENGDVIHYPNYPLNSLGLDQFNTVPHPYGNRSNNKYYFHGPNTSFRKPTLPREMKIEGYQFGRGTTYFDEVRGHSTYTILGDDAYASATALAIAESVLELTAQIANFALSALQANLPSTFPAGIIAAFAITSYTLSSIFKVGEYRYKWIEIFRNLGKPYNHAYYQVCIGHYNYFKPNSIPGSTLRGIPAISYLEDGRTEVTDESSSTDIKINNLDREDSVFIGLGSNTFNIQYPVDYANFDSQDGNSSQSSRRGYAGIGRSGAIAVNNASPYASLKQYLPAQYGSINSVEWLNTGYCGDLESILDCDPVFGGDVFISRFSLKRKLPFFTTNAADLAPLTPYKYSDYFNINPPTVIVGSQRELELSTRFYVDYLINTDADTDFISQFVFPSNRSKYNLDNQPANKVFYVKPPAKFYLFSYGIPYFLVESEINCNFRYARVDLADNFYPNIGDVVNWTQERNVSIRERNTYFYNTVYSQANSRYPYRLLPTTYNKEIYDRISKLDNAVIYSRQDVSQNGVTDPYLLYRALDFYEFPNQYGKLIELDGIESEQVLGRFVNGITLYGAIDVMRDRLTPETGSLGSGGIFSGRNINFNLTELGHAGSQHFAKVSCEFGHFWVDARRGKVFQLAPNGQGLDEISRESSSINSGCEKWFKQNLPFKILNSATNLSDTDVDNAYKGVGIAMVWDDRLKRVFITKRDYIPLDSTCYSNGRFYDTDQNNYSQLITQYETAGFTFEGFDEQCRLRFTSTVEGSTQETFLQANQVELGDKNYFEDCSFTIAYNPILKTWISYYSFKPNYYVGYNNFFQSGINYSADKSEIGLWSHLPFLSSYQVFYGKRYPFIIEYPIQTKLTASNVSHVEYWLDVRKYYEKHNFANIYGIGFDRAYVYNDHQNSGQLNLVVQNDNDMRQSLIYPQHNATSIDILQSEIGGKYSFNYIYNLIKNEKSGLPIWLYDCAQINKQLDHRLLDYTYNLKDRLRGDYQLVRLENNQNTRFKFLFRFGVDTKNYYEQ
jgi:hypothetical protein